MQPLKPRAGTFTPVAAGQDDLDRSPSCAGESSPYAEERGQRGYRSGSRAKVRRSSKHGFWHQPHLLMNLSAVVFFCLGFMMMLSSRHKQHGQLIMNYPSTSTNLDVSMIVKEAAPRTKSHEVPEIVPQLKPAPKGGIDRVEYGSYGNFVPFDVALNLKTPVNYPLNHTSSIEEELGDDENAIKLFIGVLSACCINIDKERRKLIRETWMPYSLQKHPNIHIKFILSQPGEDTAPEIIDGLKNELSQYDDIVVVPGLDTYDTLPKKTLGLMRYVMSSPVQYSHVLKTDNDCYIRVHKIFESLKSNDGSYMTQYVYMGCVEAKKGFLPIRDPKSKWHLSQEELTEDMAKQIRGVKYLAGWGYLLSRDMVSHVVWKINKWDNKEEEAPFWYSLLKWEDVMMGLLVKDRLGNPQEAIGFKAAWRACTNQTAVRHLDFDANRLFHGLYEQEVSGLWDMKTVQCSTGHFLAGDYGGWKSWRNSVIAPSQRVL